MGVGIQVWRNGASLTAVPDPTPATEGATGATVTLSWKAPNAQMVEIHVGSPSGPLFAGSGSRGSATTGAWVTDGMTFYLQDVTGGKPLTAANTLAKEVVHLLPKLLAINLSAQKWVSAPGCVIANAGG